MAADWLMSCDVCKRIVQVESLARLTFYRKKAFV